MTMVHTVVVNSFVGVVFHDSSARATDYRTSSSATPGSFFTTHYGAKQGSAGSTSRCTADDSGPSTGRPLRLSGAI